MGTGNYPLYSTLTVSISKQTLKFTCGEVLKGFLKSWIMQNPGVTKPGRKVGRLAYFIEITYLTV